MSDDGFLPYLVRETLQNALIPLKGVFWASLVLTGAGSLGAITLPEKPAEKLAVMALGSAQVGGVASLMCLSLGQMLIADAKQRLQQERQRLFGEEEEPATANPPSPQPVLQFSTVKPKACQGCRNYHGLAYAGEKGTNLLVCAIHPYGPGETCSDWEMKPIEYRLIRIQGMPCANLYFVRLNPDGFDGLELDEIIEEAVPVSREERNRLMRRFRLKSSTGLPGCVFKSSAPSINEAFRELMDSCSF